MKQAKVIFSIVAIIAAGIILWVFMGEDDDLAYADETKTWWMCAACKHDFEWTAAEARAEQKKGGEPWPPAFCPQCSEKQAYRAAICGECSGRYLGPEVPGTSGKCTNCYPDAPVRGIEEIQQEQGTVTEFEQGDQGEKKKTVIFSL